MLPKILTLKAPTPKFADSGVQLMVKDLEKMGLNIKTMEAKVVGGSSNVYI